MTEDPLPRSLEDAWVGILERMTVPPDTPIEAMRMVFYTGARIAVALAADSPAQLGLDLRAFHREIDDFLARREGTT